MTSVVLRQYVTVETAEAAMRALQAEATSSGRVHLDMTNVADFQPGSSVRIGNSLRRLRELNRALVVTLPLDPRSGGANFAPLTPRVFARQIAAHATEIRLRGAGSQTRELRKALKTLSHDGTTHETEDLVRAPLAASRSTSPVEAAISNWVDSLPPHARIEPDRLRAIGRLVAESVWNVYDHSSKSPLAPSTTVHSTFHIGWTPLANVRTLPPGFRGEDGLNRYLIRWQERQDPPVGFITISVSDDGVGMAARYALDESIYADRIELEREVFATALVAGNSVKLRSLDCLVEKKPGYGSLHIAESVRHLSAFVSIRSGRSGAYLDGDLPQTKSENSFEQVDTGSAVLPGTLLVVIVPVYRTSRPSTTDDSVQDRLM